MDEIAVLVEKVIKERENLLIYQIKQALANTKNGVIVVDSDYPEVLQMFNPGEWVSLEEVMYLIDTVVEENKVSK